MVGNISTVRGGKKNWFFILQYIIWKEYVCQFLISFDEDPDKHEYKKFALPRVYVYYKSNYNENKSMITNVKYFVVKSWKKCPTFPIKSLLNSGRNSLLSADLARYPIKTPDIWRPRIRQIYYRVHPYQTEFKKLQIPNFGCAGWWT